MKNELISVIIPIYKVERYLPRCIDSVINQNYTKLEIILVDDGSPDNCGAICDEYAKKDKRIKVIHKKNGGLSDARNAGLDIATSDYIGFVDSDDYIAEDMFELLLHNLKEANADISICGFAYVNENQVTSNYKTNNKKIYNTLDAMGLLIKDSINSFYWNKLYKRELFSELRMPVGKVYEDIFTQHLLFAKAKKVVFQDTAKYYYYMSPKSILRGGFCSNHMDALEATRERITFVKERYPQLLDIANIAHLKRAYYLLCEIANSEHNKFTVEYEMAFQELKNTWVNEKKSTDIKLKDRVWIRLILINKSSFIAIYRKYIELKKFVKYSTFKVSGYLHY